MLQFLQNYPHAMELAYKVTLQTLQPFKRWLTPYGRLESLFTRFEKVGKEAVFNCRMCGQCVLHSTGMTCPMTCPKNLRNGPCGGVRANGHCEVKPEMRCVWVQAFERSLQMPIYGHEIIKIQPPVNQQLEGSSSWINMLHDIDTRVPSGWISPKEIEVNPFFKRDAAL
jgi:hypothetical protein